SMIPPVPPRQPFRRACQALAAACLFAGVSVAAQTRPWFDDATGETGVTFVHENGATGEFHLPEIMGAGVALVDIDNDGDLDVVLVQSGKVGGGLEERRSGGREERSGGAEERRKGGGRGGGSMHQVWRNDLRVAADGTRTLTFTDVTATAGLTLSGYGMGVTTGDYDGDGFVDLYVTGLGS